MNFESPETFKPALHEVRFPPLLQPHGQILRPENCAFLTLFNAYLLWLIKIESRSLLVLLLLLSFTYFRVLHLSLICFQLQFLSLVMCKQMQWWLVTCFNIGWDCSLKQCHLFSLCLKYWFIFCILPSNLNSLLLLSALADPGGGRRYGCTTPSRSNSFHFHAIFGKHWPK